MDRATSTELLSVREAPCDAARKRAALELIRCHEQTLRRTARRYSLCGDDAEDAYQRALVILLTKAPTHDPLQLIRWMQTVTKHEALAVRRQRERLLGSPGPPDHEGDGGDWIQLIPSQRAGPADLAERRERAARSREALATLKPQELRALTLLAEGYSYREISRITGWTHTKVNRCLAEGRARFRAVISASESGSRCDDLSAALSAFCDGEASAGEAAMLREHLRACASCRATLRAFRAAPPAAAALAPPAAAVGLLDRVQEALAGLLSRLSGRSAGAEVAISGAAAGAGPRGAGLAVGLKLLAACLGTAGGAAVGLATGVFTTPSEPAEHQAKRPGITREEAHPEGASLAASFPYRKALRPAPGSGLPDRGLPEAGGPVTRPSLPGGDSSAQRRRSPEAPPPSSATPSGSELRSDGPRQVSYVQGDSGRLAGSASLAEGSLTGGTTDSATAVVLPSRSSGEAAAPQVNVVDLPPRDFHESEWADEAEPAGG
jgi:RNA polymerase sigma factor (sigma-70 family)